MEQKGITKSSNSEIKEDISPPKCCWKFDSANNRFIALFYFLFITFFSQACYDFPGPIEARIEKTFNISTVQYEYLYSFYTGPNIVLCLFSGIVIDRIFGVIVASPVIVALLLSGNLITTVGAFTGTFWVMIFGRFLAGIGGDSVGVVCSYYAVLWFVGKEVNFVFGMIVCVTRLGTSFMFLVAEPFYKSWEWYFGSKASTNKMLGATMTLNVLFMIILGVLLFALAWESKRNGKLDSKKNGNSEGSQVRFRDVVTFPLQYWIATLVIISYSVATFVFVSCSQQLLMSKYKLSMDEANYLGSIFNFIIALSAPVPGIIVDKVGKQLYFLITALGIGVISLVILTFTDWNPYIPLVIFAVALGLMSSCTLPLLPLISQPYQLGTAYGMFLSLYNLVLTLGNLLAGYLLSQYGYFANCIFYLVLLSLGLIGVILLWYLDRRDNGPLNLSNSEKKLREIMFGAE